MFAFEGSEQDLALTRKLLKTKGAMSGKGNSCYTSIANAWILSSTAFDPRLLSNNPSFLFEKKESVIFFNALFLIPGETVSQDYIIFAFSRG